VIEQRKGKNLRPKHVPQRTCVACRQTDAKRGLIRLVRNPEGRVEVDPTGKRPGRGAYLCHRSECWDKALKGKALEQALRTSLTPEDREALRTYAEVLSIEKDDPPVGPNKEGGI
jgi:predicted RNA-binding protein YlxR (DUF448 family)